MEFPLLLRYENIAFFKVLRNSFVEKSIPIQLREKSSMNFNLLQIFCLPILPLRLS